MIKAVFFDLDGVLIDSETTHQSMTEDFLRLTGLSIPPERFYLLIGSHKSLNPWAEVVRDIDLGGRTPEEVKEKLFAYKRERLSHFDYSNIVFADVRPVLMQLRQAGLPIACASSSRMEYIKKTLGDSGLLDLFDLAVTCDDFESSKPQPDIYLYCARYFGVSPAECLVVEDSPIGIAAGKNAGMTVAARIDHHFGMDQSRADYFIEDLTALPALIEHLSDVHPVC